MGNNKFVFDSGFKILLCMGYRGRLSHIDKPYVIVELTSLEYGDLPMVFLIRGKDRSHPILLCLCSGPGFAQLLVHTQFRQLVMEPVITLKAIELIIMDGVAYTPLMGDSYNFPQLIININNHMLGGIK